MFTVDIDDREVQAALTQLENRLKVKRDAPIIASWL